MVAHTGQLVGLAVVVAGVAHGALLTLRAEHDENTCRLDFAPDEAVHAKRAINDLYSSASKERQLSGLRQYGPVPQTLRNGANGDYLLAAAGETRHQVAAAVGTSHTTLEKAEEIV